MTENVWIVFFAVIGGLAGIGYLIVSILTSNASEALKYFSITIMFFIILVSYIELVVKKKNKEKGNTKRRHKNKLAFFSW